jgi:hypothetical protein
MVVQDSVHVAQISDTDTPTTGFSNGKVVLHKFVDVFAASVPLRDIPSILVHVIVLLGFALVLSTR